MLRIAKGAKASTTAIAAAAAFRETPSTSAGAAVYLVANAAASGSEGERRDSTRCIATATWKSATWSMNAAAAVHGERERRERRQEEAEMNELRRLRTEHVDHLRRLRKRAGHVPRIEEDLAGQAEEL